MILAVSLLALTAAAPAIPAPQPSCAAAARIRTLARDPVGGARQHVFQNGGRTPLRLLWVGPHGQRTEMETIPPGEIRGVSTWIGHIFILADPRGRCVRVVRIGDVLSGTYLGTSRYRPVPVRGWPVYFDRLLRPGADTTKRAIATLADRYREIEEALPPSAVATLRRSPVFVHDHSGYAAMFHPNPGWLVAHGRTVELTNGIEVSNARMFIDDAPARPGGLLHELAHAYHAQLPAEDRAAIDAAYRHAMAAGLYGKVKRHTGTVGRAYADANPQEYFAELTEAWFSRNDFYPFARDELASYDPEGATLMRRLWR